MIHRSYHYRPQGRRTTGRLKNVGESSCNFGDGTDQRVKSLMFMMMMIHRWQLLPQIMASSYPSIF
jgi:hypothetical protein